jgi:hypothetical protein
VSDLGKVLEMAAKWKQLQAQQQDDDSDIDSDDELKTNCPIA